MFGWFHKEKPSEEELYYEDLKRRREAASAQNDLFRLTIDDVFHITGRGTVVTGTVASGTVNVGDIVSLSSRNGTRDIQIGGIEALRKILTTASKGDAVGLLLPGLAPGEVARGDSLTGKQKTHAEA